MDSVGARTEDYEYATDGFVQYNDMIFCVDFDRNVGVRPFGAFCRFTQFISVITYEYECHYSMHWHWH